MRLYLPESVLWRKFEWYLYRYCQDRQMSFRIHHKSVYNLLMYKADTNNVKAIRREEKFKNSPYIKNKRFIYVDGVCYVVYTFAILNKDVRIIKQNLPISKVKSTFKISSFWNGKDEAVNRAIVWTAEPYTIQTEMVPEEDYHPSRLGATLY